MLATSPDLQGLKCTRLQKFVPRLLQMSSHRRDLPAAKSALEGRFCMFSSDLPWGCALAVVAWREGEQLRLSASLMAG